GDRYPYYTWNSNGTPDGFNQTYRGVWEKVANPERGPAARPNHTIHLHTTLYTGKPPPAYGFGVRADWNPKTEWGAAVGFTTSEMKNGLFESFHLTLRHDAHLPAPRDPNRVPGFLLGPGMAYFAAFRTDDRFVYRFHVTSRPGGARELNKKPLGSEIARYWTS